MCMAITDRDIEKLKGTFATKDDLKASHNKVIETLDAVMGELRAIRDELVILSGRQSEHADQLDDHESRLTKIESSRSPSV